jgi:beta-lactamase regulating signal transducer with metallopeptidase domain
MITADALLDVYIDINILLLFACVLWLGATAILRALGLGHAVSARLSLLRWGFLAVLASPIVVALLAEGVAVGFTLTDLIVSQYLQGRFQMDPFTLESILTLRNTTTAAMLDPKGWVALVLAVLLLGGALVCVVRLVIAWAMLRRVMRESYHWRRFGAVELRLSDTVSVPFSTRSWRRRHVVLPSAMLARSDDLRIALGHEFQHLRQGDVEWEIGLELLRPFLFWNPGFHLWKRQVEEMRELSCDRRLMARRRLGIAAYCRCLLRVCDDSLTPRRLFAVTMPVVGLLSAEHRPFAPRSAGLLRRRMEALVEARSEPAPTRLSILLLAPLAILTFAAALAMQSAGDWSQDRLMLSTILNLERLDAMNATIPSLAVPGW